MASRKNCEELKSVLDVMIEGLKYSIDGLDEKKINHAFAENKMTIGQIVVHSMSWPRYFLSKTPPWEKTIWTCRPCEYPLTREFVSYVLNDGYNSINDYLNETNDDLLEVESEGMKGKGYIIYRLLLHTMVHANQISFLRGLLEPNWDFKNYFGDMASAVIAIKYSTSRDLTIGGF